MIRRPQPGEDEGDILRMQDEYLREKDKNQHLRPAADVTNLRSVNSTVSSDRKRSNIDSSERKPSKYAQARGLANRKKPKSGTNTVMGGVLEKNMEGSTMPDDIDDDQVYFPVVIPSVLGNIVEKRHPESIDFNPPMPVQGFPVVETRDPHLKCKKSNVAQNNTVSAHSSNASNAYSDNMDIDVPAPLNIPQKSYIVTSPDANQIHLENANVLSKMSEKEILDEKRKLLSNLDPKLIAFIKSRREKPDVTEPSIQNFETVHTEEIKMERSTLADEKQMHPNVKSEETPSLEIAKGNVYDELWENDVLSHPEIHQWLHFDSLEKDKLQWLTGIKESKKVKNDEPYEARFDFNGYLLPYTIEYSEETKTLFHHGEEPHRPGYSLKELFELSRSAILQQRAMALNTIAGILEYTSAGTYKDVIDIPLSKIFFIIRIAMDENKVIILEPALKAMRNMLFNKIDEASLDALVGFEEGMQQPCLENDKSEIEELESKESELKDFHLAEIDLVTAAMRTELVQRIYYILEHVRPSFNCVQYCLQILTRLSRDCVETTNKIVTSDHLMKSILHNFVPTTSINFIFDPNLVYKGKPILAALKFLRILTLQSRMINQVLVEKYEILKPVAEYLSSGVEGTYGLRIQIDAFCILSNVLSFGLGTESAKALFPVIITALYKHVQGTDLTSSVLSATHAAVVHQCINSILDIHEAGVVEHKHQVYSLLKQGVRKWLLQLAEYENYTCGHLRLLCSALDSCKLILLIDRAQNFLNDPLKRLSKSKGYTKIIKNIIPCSNLLSRLEAENFYTVKNLKNLGACVVDSDQKVLPLLNVSSPMPFLASLFKIVELIEEPEISRCLVEPLDEYLQKLANHHPTLCDNWFTRVEVNFLVNILKVAIKDNIAESNKDLLYAVANKLCYVLRIDKRAELDFLFTKIIFNRFWFTAERLMNLVSISDSNVFSKVLTSIDDVRQCYSKTINLNYKDTGRNVVLKNWQEPILPRDWIYLPILKLYTSSQLSDVDRWAPTRKAAVVACSLEWILLNEICFPDLIKDIDLTDRFCRLMCVFLCDNALFLDSNIKPLLKNCIQNIFRKAKTQPLDFDKELVGLNNFQDFYTQFLEQFQSVSYGDPTFAACVLVPLAQRHNVKWRKLLWSEYAGCLRALDCPAAELCYELHEYLQPAEADMSLLQSYRRALAGGLLRAGTLAHTIALHHAQAYRDKHLTNIKT